jgi:hypothetical protein
MKRQKFYINSTLLFRFDMFLCKICWVSEVIMRENYLTDRLSRCNNSYTWWSGGDQPSTMSIGALMAARHAHSDQFDHHITCDAEKFTCQAEYTYDREKRDISEIAFPTEDRCEIEWNWRAKRQEIWTIVDSRRFLPEFAIDDLRACCRGEILIRPCLCFDVLIATESVKNRTEKKLEAYWQSGQSLASQIWDSVTPES